MNFLVFLILVPPEPWHPQHPAQNLQLASSHRQWLNWLDLIELKAVSPAVTVIPSVGMSVILFLIKSDKKLLFFISLGSRNSENKHMEIHLWNAI